MIDCLLFISPFIRKQCTVFLISTMSTGGEAFVAQKKINFALSAFTFLAFLHVKITFCRSFFLLQISVKRVSAFKINAHDIKSYIFHLSNQKLQ